MTTPTDSHTQSRLADVSRELDNLLFQGHRLRRSVIVEHGYRAGYVDGYQAGLVAAHEENMEVMKALMAGKVEK